MPRLLELRPPRAVAALKLLSHQCGTRRAVRTARSWVCRRVVIERWRCLACLLLRVQCLVPAIALVFGTTGFFGFTEIPRWVLALSLCERAELIGQSSSSFQLLSCQKVSCPSSATRAVFATGSSAAETRRNGRLEGSSDKSGTTRT